MYNIDYTNSLYYQFHAERKCVMKQNTWDHFDKTKVTILDRRVMKALGLKAGIEDKSYQRDDVSVLKYGGCSLFSYKGRWFVARGYATKATNPAFLTDVDGYISFHHIALAYIDIQLYRDIVEKECSIDVEILARVGYNHITWRVFKFLFEEPNWKNYYPTAVHLLEKAIQIVERKVSDKSPEEKMRMPR